MLPDDERDYPVGYGEPPPHTRFVKGQSGNPRGRSPGAKNMKTLLIGVIATGKLTDIVIWNSDPLADITVLQRPSEISTIIKDGRVIDSGTGASASCLLRHPVPVGRYRVRPARQPRVLVGKRDPRFESGFLQRRVHDAA